MPEKLSVYSFCTYYTGSYNPKPKDDTFHALKFIKAMKGDTLNQYAHVPVPSPTAPGGVMRCHLDASNADDVFGWFGEIVAPWLRPIIDRKTVLVPVPSSSATDKAAVEAGRTYRLAQEVAMRAPNCLVGAYLWWDQPMSSARSQGGPRHPVTLLPHLVSFALAPQSVQYVLVDDVLTSGGHLLACEAKLNEKRLSTRFAIAAGRTVDIEEDQPFSVVRRDLVVHR